MIASYSFLDSLNKMHLNIILIFLLLLIGFVFFHYFVPCKMLYIEVYNNIFYFNMKNRSIYCEDIFEDEVYVHKSNLKDFNLLFYRNLNDKKRMKLAANLVKKIYLDKINEVIEAVGEMTRKVESYEHVYVENTRKVESYEHIYVENTLNKSYEFLQTNEKIVPIFNDKDVIESYQLLEKQLNKMQQKMIMEQMDKIVKVIDIMRVGQANFFELCLKYKDFYSNVSGMCHKFMNENSEVVQEIKKFIEAVKVDSDVLNDEIKFKIKVIENQIISNSEEIEGQKYKIIFRKFLGHHYCEILADASDMKDLSVLYMKRAFDSDYKLYILGNKDVLAIYGVSNIWSLMNVLCVKASVRKEFKDLYIKSQNKNVIIDDFFVSENIFAEANKQQNTSFELNNDILSTADDDEIKSDTSQEDDLESTGNENNDLDNIDNLSHDDKEYSEIDYTIHLLDCNHCINPLDDDININVYDNLPEEMVYSEYDTSCMSRYNMTSSNIE